MATLTFFGEFWDIVEILKKKKPKCATFAKRGNLMWRKFSPMRKLTIGFTTGRYSLENNQTYNYKKTTYLLCYFKQATEMLLMYSTRELETKQKIGPWKFQWTTFPRKEIRSPGTKKNTWPRRNLSLGPPEDYTIAKTNWATKLDESNSHFYAFASFESADEVLMCEYSNRSLFFNMKLQNEINDFIFHFECELLLAV